MNWILYIIGVLWLVFGVCMILYTDSTRSSMGALLKNVNLKVIAAGPLIAGILLVLSASASHYPWFVRLIGFLAVVKGILIAVNPNGFFDGINDWFVSKTTDQSYRFFGIIFLVLGTAVISWVV